MPKKKNYISTNLKKLSIYLDSNNIVLSEKRLIIFAISLKSKRVARNWETVIKQFGKTLRSILNNTHQNFKIIVAGHEKPDIKELNNNKVTWIGVNFPISRSKVGMSTDKMNKRKAIAQYLSAEGFSGYFMPLDADDWVHYRLVEFINKTPFTKAIIFNKGIMSNLMKNEIWMISNFYKHCGSCSIFYFQNEQFPSDHTYKGGVFHALTLTSHPKIIQYLKMHKVKYSLVDFPLVFRVFGYGDNNLTVKGKLSLDLSASNFNTTGVPFHDEIFQYFKSN